MKQKEKPKVRQSRSTVPRILTVTTGDINEILEYKDIIFALYEVYGKIFRYNDLAYNIS